MLGRYASPPTVTAWIVVRFFFLPQLASSELFHHSSVWCYEVVRFEMISITRPTSSGLAASCYLFLCPTDSII
eukprot:SAG31_NODE_1913_length_6933_cov_9.849722_1_plen_72_part_10